MKMATLFKQLLYCFHGFPSFVPSLPNCDNLNMSLLKMKVLFCSSRKISTSAIRLGAWNKDWKPGKYPKTQEERLAAAKKYGLLPQEYKPIPDDGQGAGDYPDLEAVSVEARDQFYPWDIPEYRRNFCEVLHHDANILTEDRYNINYKPRYPLYVQLACYLGVMSAMFALQLYSENACFLPAAKHPLPAPGVKHYTYE